MEPQPIELHVRSVEQLFNPLDHSPLPERDLDEEAEHYIVGTARELDRRRPFVIVLHLPERAAKHRTARDIPEGLHHYFRYRSEQAAVDLRELFRLGRWSLSIGLCVLVAAVLVNQAVRLYLPDSAIGNLIAEGFFILGWVANWRPLEIFLYDWWPIRRKRNLLAKLAATSVELRFEAEEGMTAPEGVTKKEGTAGV
ncbi:MAG TPA: hypothetical protein VHA10_15390 [Hypericibacter adhaerens]|jgi:hypothetical protein|uniref:hypothetical protein n=1 Tax=Hypericibacter adhaerens TaxID=2602016 RepID=UPI002C99DF60|nr:hypothetical protein [Hypericibacter adhaerens]HWA44599.1 hypothetical protein [Hypericibacter adhaerens]